MAHQDNRLPAFEKHNVTEIYRDQEKLVERVKGLQKGGLIVLRGLPGSGKTKILNKLKETIDCETFNMVDYLPETTGDTPTPYTVDNVKKAHQLIRKKIKKMITNSKSIKPIVVSAPHVYLWELKYYKVISCQLRMPYIIYECRTLFSKKNEERIKQLSEFDISKMINDVKEWLAGQKNKLLPAQVELLNYLSSPNAVKLSQSKKPVNNSFCPSVFLNIQLAAWLTNRCEHNIFMDLVWQYIVEWEEIKNEESMYKSITPRWGW